MKWDFKLKAKAFLASTGAALVLGACATPLVAEPTADAELDKFIEWHLGYATNQAQYDADKAANADPAWAFSALRFQQIWADRTDGVWLYYETQQPDVRPDRNEIWRVYRNDLGNLRVDLYYFKDIQAGLTFWGKGDDVEAFSTIGVEDLDLKLGCGLTYHWVPEFEIFSGINPHGTCAVGTGYVLQHLEISKDETGNLIRKDWHWFFDSKGEAKAGTGFKLGIHGAYVHEYVDE